MAVITHAMPCSLGEMDQNKRRNLLTASSTLYMQAVLSVQVFTRRSMTFSKLT